MAASATTILFAHDLRSKACDVLLGRVVLAVSKAPWLVGGASLDGGLAAPHVEEIGSLEAGWEALDRASKRNGTTLVVSCLDLVPAPRAGGTLAGWASALALPVIVVARGRRWLGDDSPAASLPVLSPLASNREVERALAGSSAASPPWPAPDEAFPSRPSWLG